MGGLRGRGQCRPRWVGEFPPGFLAKGDPDGVRFAAFKPARELSEEHALFAGAQEGEPLISH
jgi:hypothetical protein